MFKITYNFEIKYWLTVSRPKHLDSLAVQQKGKDRKVNQFWHKQKAGFISKINLLCKN